MSGFESKHTVRGPGEAHSFLQTEALLQNLIDKAAVPTFLVGFDGQVYFANKAFCNLLGYTPEEVTSLGIKRIVHPDDAPTARAQVAALSAGKISSYRGERRYLTKTGEHVWVLTSATPLIDEKGGQASYYTIQAVDISGQKQAEAALAESESRWNNALEAAGQGVWDYDLRDQRAFFSPMWRQMRGIGPDDAVDPSTDAWLARVHPEDRKRINKELDGLDSGHRHSSFEYRERHRDGHWMWILSRGRAIVWIPNGSAARIVGTDTDITALKDQEARAAEEKAETYRNHLATLEKAHAATEAAHRLAESLARHDALTGLANRRVFSEAMEMAVARANRGLGVYAAMIIDLDRFKPVNDIHGHPVGDLVLREIAARLGKVVRKTDTLARLGGDEFGVILSCNPAKETPAEASAALAERIIEAVNQSIDVAGTRIRVGATIGIAICPGDGAESDTLMRAADMAMYDAKEGGRGTFCFFQKSMEMDLRARAQLEDDIRKAVANHDIHPFYQPLIQLAENRLVGFEILARWHHPERGNVTPDVFIPIVEKIGLIADLTYALLRQACLDAKEWPAELTVALNVSPQHFSDSALPVKLLAILSETGFPPSRLEIEVTEHALVADLPAARTVLVALQNCGMKVSLDDFGTGYSSLYHLRELRFDKIKIDRSFVLAMNTDVESRKIVRSVIDLAKSLGMPTIAEGIEHVQALREIMQRGGEYGQGFHFGKAMPAEEANALARSLSEVVSKKRA